MVLPEVTTLAEARNAIRDLAEEVEKLSNELTWFKRQMFGSKTEHYIPEDDTPSLFPEQKSPEPSKEVQTATVSEHERKVRQPNALSEIPADLPREERVIDVPEEEREGMVLISDVCECFPKSIACSPFFRCLSIIIIYNPKNSLTIPPICITLSPKRKIQRKYGKIHQLSATGKVSAGCENVPLHQNLWAKSGSGSSPSW